MIRVTYYTEITSSWCYWAEPAWAQLRQTYPSGVEFRWKIALLDANSLPTSRAQLEWFYRRSGVTVRSDFMLNSGWYEQGCKEYLVANVVPEAAKDLGVNDDRVRLAITRSALVEGNKVTDLDTVVGIAAKAGSLSAPDLKALAQKPEIEQRVRASTAEFHALQVTQRPTFVVENDIGDKAVLAGTWQFEPIRAVISSMISDESAYRAWATHFGKPPPQ